MELQHQVPFERKKEMGEGGMQCSTHDKLVFVMVGVKMERMNPQREIVLCSDKVTGLRLGCECLLCH